MRTGYFELQAKTNMKKLKISILVEFEVFTKICSLSPRLAIPMFQIVIKHLKVSLIVYFLRGLPFLRSLLALTVIWRVHITALLTARDPNKYTELQYFNIPAKHNLFCLKWTLGELMGKNILMCNFDSCITVGRLSQCYLSIKEKMKSLVAIH